LLYDVFELSVVAANDKHLSHKNDLTTGGHFFVIVSLFLAFPTHFQPMKSSVERSLFKCFSDHLDGKIDLNLKTECSRVKKGSESQPELNFTNLSGSREQDQLDQKEITKQLSTNRQTGLFDDFQSQSLFQTLKAREMASQSAKAYNIEQDQYCRTAGVNPNEWRIHEDDYEIDSKPIASDCSSSCGSTSSQVNEKKKRSSEDELKVEAFNRRIATLTKVIINYHSNCITIIVR